MILYNGASGSLGQYFAAALHAAGAEGHPIAARLEDRAGLARELEGRASEIHPGTKVCLVQMAAKVSVPACEQDPVGARKTNVTDAVSTVSDFTRWASARGALPSVVYVSSGHVYAAQEPGSKATEAAPLEPRSEYARTKLAAERELTRWAEESRHPLTIARVFGLIAPRQPSHYMLQGLIRRVRQNELTSIPGLSFYRDFLDSRDVCDHLVCMAQTGLGDSPPRTQVVNVCSGAPVQLRDVVLHILRELRPSEAEAVASALVEAPGRADDVPWIVGDPGRLVARWRRPAQRIPLPDTIGEAVRA